MINHDHGGAVFAIARQLGLPPEEIIDFSASINPLGMPAGVRAAVIGQVDSLVHYPEADAGPLRDALAAFHGVAAEQICPSNGTTELIYLLPRLVPGSRALIVSPAFSEYAKGLAAAGWGHESLCLSPDEGFSLDMGSLRDRLSAGYGILYLCNPGNPTGKLYSRSEIGQVADLCRSCGTLLALDEAFIDFCGEEASAVQSVAASGNVVVLRSMTKFYAIPGLRLGYAVTDAATATRLAELRGPWSVGTLAQAAGLAALAGADFRVRTLKFIACERTRLFGLLSSINGFSPFPASANYLLIRLDGGRLAKDIRRELLARRLLIRDCSLFDGLNGSYMRVAIRLPEQDDMLVASLREIMRSAC